MLRRALAASLLLLVACAGGKAGPLEPPRAAASPAPAEKVSSPRAGHREFSVDARLRMVVTGETPIGPIDTETSLRIVEIWQGRNPREIWFYSVSPVAPVPLGDGRLLLFTADLSPGLYEGPGRYELSDEAGVNVAGKEGIGSAAYVQIYRTGGRGISPEEIEESFRRFDRFGAPCVLTVTADSMTGTVDCPELRDGDGRTVELHWNWGRL